MSANQSSLAEAEVEAALIRFSDMATAHPEWRKGQAAFNAMPAWLQEEVQGGPLDPFHEEEGGKVASFLAWAVQRIDQHHQPRPDGPPDDDTAKRVVRAACEAAGVILPARELGHILHTHRSHANRIVRDLYGPDPLAPLERQAAGPRPLPEAE
jgi:hypothetical protein